MQQTMIATYLDLMTALHDLPGEIASTQELLTAVKATIGDSERILEEIEGMLKGRAADESNDAKRKAKLAELLSQHEGYRKLTATLAKEKMEAAQLGNTLKDYERRYEAVCYQSRLHAALMQYLGSAGAPVTPVTAFSIPVNGFNQVVTTGAVTLADAAEIGL
jgi:hypothetical protein